MVALTDAPPLTPEETVRAFADAWSRLDLDRVIAMLHPAIKYHNIPLEPLLGRSAVEQYLRTAGPFDSCCWTLVALAANGNRVLTERIDELTLRGTLITLPVMGIFLIDRGLISEWRDYFDLASYRAQWPREAEQ